MSTSETTTDPDEVERLALGTLLPSFRGTAAPEWVIRALEKGLAGVTLFGPNIVDDEQLRALTNTLRSTGEPLIALDEEGGDVTRINYWTGSRYPGNAALGVVDDLELTRTVSYAIGADLAALGVNFDLAPSGDVNAVAENPIIGTRAFGSQAQLVARHTAAAIDGIQSAGVAACVKHFPGHGATRQDSHDGIPVVDASIDLLERRDLPPFRAAVDAGTKALMTAHVRVPELTGSEPATLSPAALQGVVRKDLGFEGVIVTDALDMKAITETFGLAHGAVLSLAAGSNLLCLGPIPDQQEVTEIITAIVAAVRAGELELSHLEESVAKVHALKEWLRGFDPPADPRTDIGLDAARRALRVSGDGLPLQAPPYVVEVATPPTIAVGEVPWGLSEFVPDTARFDPNGDTTPAEVASRAGERTPVIVVRDAHRNPDCRSYVEGMLASRPDSVVVEMGLPLWQPACGAYVATYGAAQVNARAAAEALAL